MIDHLTAADDENTRLRARIEQLEAALREISIYDANITKTIREALAPEQDK